MATGKIGERGLQLPDRARSNEEQNAHATARRFVKKQQMQWTARGAHLLLQTRTKVLNGDLHDALRRWYPRFRARAA